MLRMFNNLNCSAGSSKKVKRQNILYRKMTWRDQTEARTNAANMSAVRKNLKLSKTQKSLQAPTAIWFSSCRPQ